jgi:hypothetical protein
MSNVISVTTVAKVDRDNLQKLLNGEKKNIILPEDMSGFNVTLVKDSLPECMQGMPDDIQLRVFEHMTELYVEYDYTVWKDKTPCDIFEYLKQFSAHILEYAIDLDSDLYRTPLDATSPPCYIGGRRYTTGAETSAWKEDVLDL